MKNRRNFYRILSVQPDAPTEVIKASYRALMRDLKKHPDLGGDVWSAQVLNEAYATLVDPAKRLAYDRLLFKRYTKQPLRNPISGCPPAISIFCPFCKRPLSRPAKPSETCPSCRSPLRSAGEDALEHACRRSLPRVKKSGSFLFYTTWPQKGMRAELVDISKKGLRFTTAERLSRGTLIKISSRRFKGVARINNVYKLMKGHQTRYSSGGEFISITFHEPRGGFYSNMA